MKAQLIFEFYFSEFSQFLQAWPI